jgi:chromosome segregation ATPase
MKRSEGFICIVCFGVFLVAIVSIVGEQHSKQQVAKVEAIADLGDRAEQAEKYSLDLLDVIKSLSYENTLLCERDAKTLQVVAEFEDENRRLKCSLSDAVTRLEDQQTEINSLIDQTDDLRYKVEVLEKALDNIHPIVK